MIRKFYLPILFLLLIFASACKGEATPQPTTDPGQMETQVAEEVASQLTQIALSQPTATMPAPSTDPATEVPSPTATSLPPSEATATLAPASPTPLPPSPTNTAPASTTTVRPSPTNTPAPFDCQVVKQDPENGKTFKPNDNFDAVWTVKNIGTEIWDKNEVDYVFESGDEFYKIEGYDLSKNVEPGDSIDLGADMKAPDEEGEYETTWVLLRGSNLLCTLTLEINVQK